MNAYGQSMRHISELWRAPTRTVAGHLAAEDGQGMVEYALILVLIAVVVIVILILLGNRVKNLFSNVSGGLGS